MRGWFRRRPIRVRITLAFLAAMALLLLASGAFIYERMQFALDRSIRDVPKAQSAEILARRRHRNEALAELLVQLAVAYTGTLAIAGFVGYRMTRAALVPVETMQRQAAAPGPDGSRVRLEVPPTDDELSRLARTLNGLLARRDRAVENERRFIADASHELRTPLSLLKLHVDVALSRDRTADELRHSLERVGAETDRLTRLADALLLIAQAEEEQLDLVPTPVSVPAALAEAAERFAERARSDGRRLALGPVDADVVVRADPDRLQQALTAMLDNAFRHGEGEVRLRCDATGDRAWIHVTDEGPGFPDGFAATAFERFSTASRGRNGRGTGLGLAIVEAIAAAHGGHATAANRTPAGADVSMALPLADAFHPLGAASQVGDAALLRAEASPYAPREQG